MENWKIGLARCAIYFFILAPLAALAIFGWMALRDYLKKPNGG